MGCGRKCQLSLALAGICLIVFGCLLHMHWDALLRQQMERKFIISPTSKTYESWMKTKSPGTNRFYFFNWTNPADLSLPNYKPVFEEVGPYVFYETLEKVEVAFHDNGTASYRTKRQWFFDRERSVGPLTDRITSANPVAASVKYTTRFSFSMSTLTRIAAPYAFHYKSVKTVGELLFDGYEDKLINLGRFSQMFFTEVQKIPYDKFGWWYPRNGSLSEVFNMETGANGMDKFGELREWDHKRNTGSYNGSCANVRGSGGNFWPWNRTKTEDVVLFSGDICRPLTLSFEEEFLYGGLPAYKYESGPSFVDNGTLVRGNECLCNGECSPVGVFNASVCSKGAPVFISYPHFQYADPYYSNAVVGMRPERGRHVIRLVLEPTYGVPLELSAPIQINLLIETNSESGDWDNERKKRIYFPVLWVDQNFKIMEEDLRALELLRYLPQLGFIMAVISIVMGALVVLGSLVWTLVHKNRTVPFREMGTIQINGGQVTELTDKHNIKFNYLKDSHL